MITTETHSFSSTWAFDEEGVSGDLRRRWLLIIDNGPIRRRIVDLYHSLEEVVEALRARIDAHEIEDVPAHQRWEARVFGALLSEIREVRDELEFKRRLLNEIEEEMMSSGSSPAVAFRKVMNRRNGVVEDEEVESASEDSDLTELPGDTAEEEREEEPKFELPTELLPEGFDREAFEQLTPEAQLEFRREYARLAGTIAKLTGRIVPTLDEVLGLEPAEPRAPGEESAAPEQPPSDPIKDLYRALVRKLHPDTGVEMGKRERELWHQVQEAYRDRDLTRLQLLAGRVEISVGGDAGSLPVSVLIAMCDELRQAETLFQDQLSNLAKSSAWTFCRLNPEQLENLEIRTRRTLERHLKTAEAELSVISEDLEGLEEQAAEAG